MNGTVMITSQTTGTPSVMKPYRGCTFDIIHRTDLRALAAMDADIRIHCELLVCDHPLVEVATDYVGIEAGSGTLFQFLDTPLAILQNTDNMVQLALGVLNLPMLLVLRISFHKRQTDVRFRHDH